VSIIRVIGRCDVFVRARVINKYFRPYLFMFTSDLYMGPMSAENLTPSMLSDVIAEE
jgi:hypothetical protein